MAEAPEVRPYHLHDALALARVYNRLFPAESVAPGEFGERLERLKQGGGSIWVVEVGGRPAGYASIRPVPGLQGIYDLQGGIAPQQQRQGLGSLLLQQLLIDLVGTEVYQIAHPVLSLDSPAACFLRCHHFFVEHEEWFMDWDSKMTLPEPTFPAGFQIRSFSNPVAIATFRRLYEQAFANLPWYQPYENDAEVAADLADAGDLIFLCDDRIPIGFAWMHWLEPGLGEIEPIGIMPTYQQKGLGPALLSAAMGQLLDQGAKRVRMGVWRDNEKAIRLYGRFGFCYNHSVFYLAYNLNS